MSKNEGLYIVDDEPESGNDMLEIVMESFISLIQSKLNNNPLYYSGDSDRMNQHRRSEISKDANLMGQESFSSWGNPNPAYPE